MNQVFVIRQQNNLYLSKQQEWLNGEVPQLLFRAEHHDIALNTLIEANARSVSLRLDIIAVDQNNKGWPLVEVSPATMTDTLISAEVPTAAEVLPEAPATQAPVES